MAAKFRKERRRGSLLLPLAVVAVIALSAAGVFATVRQALPLLAEADLSRVFDAPGQAAELPPDTLKAEILNRLNDPRAGNGVAEFDGCLLRLTRVGDACAQGGTAVTYEQVDLRDVFAGPAFAQVSLTKTASDGTSLSSLTMPWRPQAHRAALAAAEGLSLPEVGAARDTEGPPDAADATALAEALSDGAYGPAMARNFRIEATCDRRPRALSRVEPLALSARTDDIERLADLLHALVDGVCPSRGWLF